MATPTDLVACVGAVYAMLHGAHSVADHFVQTQHQADTKGLPGWAGRWACAKHVLTYTVTAGVFLSVLVWRTGVQIHPSALAAGLTVSAVSHYVADRRTPLRRIADGLGKSPAWLDHGGGMYALDQAWHLGFTALTALIIGGAA